jgi:phosphoglycolate phosphatase
MAVADQDPGGPARLAIPIRLGIVFDLDGTLIDSRYDIANAANHALSVHGFSALSVPEIASYVGDGARALLARAARLEPEAPELGPLLPGAHEALAQLTHLPLALCTNKPRSITDAVLANLRLPVRFAAVVAGGDLAKIKPDPLPLQHLAQALSLTPAELVMVGDGPQDILCAKAAGARSVAVEGGMQARERLLATNPDVVLPTLAGLPEVIERWLDGA